MSTVSGRYLADKTAPYSRLEAKPFFETLTLKEKKYAHYMSRAAFEGTRIIITQTNPNALPIYELILNTLSNGKGEMVDLAQLRENSGVSEEAFEDFIQYTAQFLSNLSNYKSFGDEKFIPRIASSDFEKITEAAGTQALFKTVQTELYQTEPAERNLLGFPSEGHQTGYYSGNIQPADIQLSQEFLQAHQISPLNTRLFKTEDGRYQLKVAAANASQTTYQFEGRSFEILSEFEDQMRAVTDAIRSGLAFTANATQTAMLSAYATSFETGSIEAHKESQRHWLQDLSPRVETNLGFIETYRDPQGVRAEWEGFVAMVNREQTKKFNRLVENATVFVGRLPWSGSFERDTLNKPDFTSLEVLSFATAGIPAGINIPNYEDITQLLGSKNVSLGNVLSASAPGERFPFLREQDLDLYRSYRNRSFEVQVGTHELGHGTGKLFSEDSEGRLNFERDLINPLTGQAVSGWYRPGESFNSKFKSIASSYEECRAECIALSLSPYPDILKIFDYEGQEAEDIVYIMYLNMARAGLAALEFYDVQAKKWGQAHMQARYAIMNVMLKAGDEFLKINRTDNDSLEIHMDREKIRSVGHPAVSKFLTQLQIYKATADDLKGTELYLDATAVPEEWYELRDIVIQSKQPRKIFVQANTFIEDDQVILKEYEPSAVGMIQSFIERKV